MTKYQWNLYDIKNNLNILNQMLKKTTDENKEILITDSITQYQMMLYEVSKKDCSDDDNYSITLENCMKNFIEDLDLSDIDLLNMLLKTFTIVKDFDITPGEDFIISLGNDFLVEMSDDFMKKTLPTSLFNKYKKQLLEYKDHLHIKYCPCNNNNGLTYIDPVLMKKYILINRHNDITDLYVLAHEYFHFLFNDFKSHLSFNSSMHYSQEIEGSLANMLFSDYLGKQELIDSSYEISNQIDNTQILYYKLRTISLVILCDYLQSMNEDGKFRTNKFNKFLNYFEFKTPLEESEISEYIGKENADDAITYNLSFLAALDLFYIYKDDPEMAFYLLQNIRFIKENDDLINVLRRNHITFMDDDFKNLKKYIKSRRQ